MIASIMNKHGIKNKNVTKYDSQKSHGGKLTLLNISDLKLFLMQYELNNYKMVRPKRPKVSHFK